MLVIAGAPVTMVGPFSTHSVVNHADYDKKKQSSFTFHIICTHPVPEHVGGVMPTVLVMLLAAAVWNYFLL